MPQIDELRIFGASEDAVRLRPRTLHRLVLHGILRQGRKRSDASESGRRAPREEEQHDDTNAAAPAGRAERSMTTGRKGEPMAKTASAEHGRAGHPEQQQQQPPARVVSGVRKKRRELLGVCVCYKEKRAKRRELSVRARRRNWW